MCPLSDLCCAVLGHDHYSLASGSIHLAIMHHWLDEHGTQSLLPFTGDTSAWELCLVGHLLRGSQHLSKYGVKVKVVVVVIAALSQQSLQECCRSEHKLCAVPHQGKVSRMLRKRHVTAMGGTCMAVLLTFILGQDVVRGPLLMLWTPTVRHSGPWLALLLRKATDCAARSPTIRLKPLCACTRDIRMLNS